jgi:hypothetical protein
MVGPLPAGKAGIRGPDMFCETPPRVYTRGYQDWTLPGPRVQGGKVCHFSIMPQLFLGGVVTRNEGVL